MTAPYVSPEPMGTSRLGSGANGLAIRNDGATASRLTAARNLWEVSADGTIQLYAPLCHPGARCKTNGYTKYAQISGSTAGQTRARDTRPHAPRSARMEPERLSLRRILASVCHSFRSKHNVPWGGSLGAVIPLLPPAPVSVVGNVTTLTERSEEFNTCARVL